MKGPGSDCSKLNNTGVLLLIAGMMLAVTAACDGWLMGPQQVGVTIDGGPAESDGLPQSRLSKLVEESNDSQAYCANLCQDEGSCDDFCMGHRPCKHLCNLLCTSMCQPGVQPPGGSDAGLAPDSGAAPPPPPPPPPPAAGGPYYVRPKGGTPTQCTGQTNADYPGSGTGQACAYSHLFFLLPPSGKALLKGGDTVYVASGSYRMGLGAPGASSCDKAYPWDCVMPAIPSGTAAKPTRILGQGWNSGCKQAPQLYGVERAWRVLDLKGSSHVQLQCLEVTDRSSCVEGHSGSLSCNRSKYPYGDWAAVGLRAMDSTNVLLKHVDIHGLAHTGIHAGRVRDWTLEDSKIDGNGWVGWDGDLADAKLGSSNSGKLIFRRVSISWNGCGETYPGRKPTGCWGQSAGGYGDGLGTHATGGDWVFDDCRVMHNTSDGIDLLYHSLGGSITINRLRAEGNAGNQLKVTGNASITNSVLVGTCAYFNGKSFTHNVDACRALGNTLSVHYVPGAKVTLTNSTLYGQGDVLVLTGVRAGKCNGSETLTAQNNIFIGDTEYHSPSDKAALFYNDGCAGLDFDADYSVYHRLKGTCAKIGANDLCQDPLLGAAVNGEYGVMPKADSPAVDSGKAVGGVVPAVDLLGVKRPQGGGVDRGACEFKKP